MEFHLCCCNYIQYSQKTVSWRLKLFCWVKVGFRVWIYSSKQTYIIKYHEYLFMSLFLFFFTANSLLQMSELKLPIWVIRVTVVVRLGGANSPMAAWFFFIGKREAVWWDLHQKTPEFNVGTPIHSCFHLVQIRDENEWGDFSRLTNECFTYPGGSSWA